MKGSRMLINIINAKRNMEIQKPLQGRKEDRKAATKKLEEWSRAELEAEVAKFLKKESQKPYKTIQGKRTDVLIFMNPGHGVSNWAFEVIARGTGRTEQQYIPIDRMADAQRTLRLAQRFMRRRGIFWWFYDLAERK